MLASSDEAAFTARKLDLEMAIRLGARFEAGKFLFDYRLDGKLQFRKVRTPEKRFYIEPSGQRLQFWNLDAVRELPSRPSEPLVITEGEFDTIAVAQSCGGYVLSVPNGGVKKRTEKDIVIAEDTGFSYLWSGDKLLPEVAQFDKIILATDGDETGQILRDELALRIGDSRCWYVTYPEGCKDANDVLVWHGEEGVRALIANAKPIRPGHLVKPSDIPPRTREVAYSTGWGFMDKHLLLVRPELVVVTGMPGHGKGEFIRSMAYNMAEAHGWRTAFLTPEDPAHRVKRGMRRFALRNTPYANKEQQTQAFAWIDDHFRISQPPEDEPLTLEMVEHEMEVAALHHGCQMFVIDPWNEIDHRMARGDTTDTYIERSLRQLKRKMRRLGLVLVIAAHPTKLGHGDIPNLYSINGSANWRNKAEHGIIVFREKCDDDKHIKVEHSKMNPVLVIVEKSKDWETMGTPGEIKLSFKRDLSDYVELKQ